MQVLLVNLPYVEGQDMIQVLLNKYGVVKGQDRQMDYDEHVKHGEMHLVHVRLLER